MGERYCLRCGKVVLDPNVNYGINPDVVCKCPPEQASLASGIPHHQVSQWTKTTQEKQAIDRALWSEIGLAIGRIESALESVCGELLVKDGLLSYRTQQKALLDGLALKQAAILELLVAFKRQNEQLTEESRAIVKERGDRLLAIELSLETLGLQQDVIEKKLDERIAPSKTFGDWWHSVGHTHMPKNGEPPIHASIAELAWNAALRAQPKRKRERKGKRVAERTGK